MNINQPRLGLVERHAALHVRVTLCLVTGTFTL
jgi:hypothetical protein